MPKFALLPVLSVLDTTPKQKQDKKYTGASKNLNIVGKKIQKVKLI